MLWQIAHSAFTSASTMVKRNSRNNSVFSFILPPALSRDSQRRRYTGCCNRRQWERSPSPYNAAGGADGAGKLGRDAVMAHRCHQNTYRTAAQLAGHHACPCSPIQECDPGTL